MPRINQQATNELLAAQANARYIEEHFPGASVNDAWFQDFVFRTYSSKVYGHGIVTTQMDPPFETTFEEFD